MAYCRPEHLHENAENIGAYLEGDREENSLYDLEVGVPQACRVLCSKVGWVGVGTVYPNPVISTIIVR